MRLEGMMNFGETNIEQELLNQIEEKENQIKVLQEEMLKDEISTDYIKLKEIEDKIKVLNNEIESKMLEWEEWNEKCK